MLGIRAQASDSSQDRPDRLAALHAEGLSALSGSRDNTVYIRLPKTTRKVATPVGELPLGSSVLNPTVHQKTSTQSIQKCGDTSVIKPARVKLAEEFQSLNTSLLCCDSAELERNTRDQSDSELWHSERMKRLTASNFARVLNRKKTITDVLLKSLFTGSSKHINVAPLKHGREHEATAKERYLEKYPYRHFHPCGLVVNNDFAFLGASPDGIVCDNGKSGIVEVKCPYSARDMSLLEACNNNKIAYLKKTDTGKLSLDKRHKHYAQVQGQLMVTGSDFCEFIVFTRKDLHVERILPDTPYMSSSLNTLATFYRDHAVSFIMSKCDGK